MAKQINRLISYLLIFTLTVNSTFIFAEEKGPQSKLDKKSETFILNDMEDGSLGVNKTVARPLTRYVLKKMGTPGFLIGKYMQYRRLINSNPNACTLSEKMLQASIILSIISDVSNHVIAYKDSKDLKKEFEEKKEKIDELLKEDSDFTKNFNEDKDVKSVPVEEIDLQFLAIDYLITKEEKDLKRLKIIRLLRYPAIALNLMANLINASEMFMESTSFGAYIAKVNACKTADHPRKAAQEAKTTALAEAKKATSEEAKNAIIAKEKAKIAQNVSETNKSNERNQKRIDEFGGVPDSAKSIISNLIPWFLEPFKWLATYMEKTKQFKGQLNKGDGNRQNETAEAVESQGGSLLNGVSSFMDSANYAEEMIVNVIYHFKKDSNRKGLSGAIVDDIEDKAIRYSVRALVKANIVTIDGFLRSSFGRAVLFAYNLWLSYTQIEQHEEAIEYTEYKIQKLKEYKIKIEKATKTVVDLKKPVLENNSHLFFVINLFKNVITGSLNANLAQIDEDENLKNLRICFSNDNCKSQFDILKDANVNDNFKLLPEEIKNSQIDIIKNSYTVAQFSKISKGQAGLFSFDLDKVKSEIATNEKKLNDQFVLLDKKKIITFDQLAKFEEKISLSNIEPLQKHLREDYASINTKGDILNFSTGESTEDFMKNFEEVSSFSKFKKEHTSTSLQNTGDVFKPNPFAINGVGARSPANNDEPMAEDYEFKETIHQKDQNIFEIIKSRYLKLYNSLGIIE